MCGKSKGFTLIEIMVVIGIIALLATIAVPNFSKLSLKRERQTFLGDLNSLLLFSWQQALVTHKIHRITFDLKNKRVRAEVATDKTKDGNVEFGLIKRAYRKTSIPIPAMIEIKNFIIEGFDEIGRAGAGSKTLETFFYLMPDGLAQGVTINFIDKKDKNYAGKPRQFGLVLNPFTAQFNVYDRFQK